jgi:hypothetical protein
MYVHMCVCVCVRMHVLCESLYQLTTYIFSVSSTTSFSTSYTVLLQPSSQEHLTDRNLSEILHSDILKQLE